MKNINFLLTLLLCPFFIFSQDNVPDDEGAIKTEKGFLLYYNHDNPYTIDLTGDVDLSRYPILNINGDLFEFLIGYSKPFGMQEKEILLNYMKWESDYIEEVHNQSIKVEHKFIKTEKHLVNFWSYKNPALKNYATRNEKQFFIDFYKKGRVYRFTALLFQGSDKEAEKQLLEIINNIQFYNNKIDVFRLSRSIKNKELYVD